MVIKLQKTILIVKCLGSVICVSYVAPNYVYSKILYKDNVLLFYGRIYVCMYVLTYIGMCFLIHSFTKSSYGNYATMAIKIDILSRFSDLGTKPA